MENLEAALEYQEKHGFSVIPVKRNKQPYVAWEKFQNERASEELIKQWWDKWPGANVGIVTGEISGIDVIDEDTEEAHKKIEEQLPDNFLIPTARTPRGGYHRYIKHIEALRTGVNFLDGLDYRGQGGYVVAPPSVGQNGKGYRWLDGLSLDGVEPPALPRKLVDFLTSQSNRLPSQQLQIIPGELEKIPEGQRDEMLFHVANTLIRGKMPAQEVQQLLGLMALHCCNPPFPIKDIPVKIKSALARAERQQRNISQEVREFVMSSWGQFLSRDVQECLGLSSRKDQQAIYWGLKQLVNERIIERVEKRYGCYRRIESEVEEMDFKNASVETVDLTMPFDIEEKVEFMDGNIIVIAGEPNVGKTAFLLNVVLMNQEKKDVHYFSSEMGASELRKRLSKFDYPLDAWTFKAKERSDNFGDVIMPGQGRLNIVDFLEVYDNFYIIGGHLAEIHKKLKGAIAIVAIQKNPGSDVGLGGFRGLEKPRLYLAMSPGKLKIVKAKNFRGSQNPNRLQVNFRIVDGCKLVQRGEWYYAQEEEDNSTVLDNPRQTLTSARQSSTNSGAKNS